MSNNDMLEMEIQNEENIMDEDNMEFIDKFELNPYRSLVQTRIL